MRLSFQTGLSFGLTSGIITTLGLIVGLNAGTHSRLPVIGGILTIAVADAFSDALGIHISQEARPGSTFRDIWESTISAWLAKFFITVTFIIPVILLDLSQAIIFSIIWGITILTFFSYLIARHKKESPGFVIMEHISIAVIVILLSHLIGVYISRKF
ncbi:hypothetical protein A3D05_05610 [Candidatus Gottesmanbacteria bacterium RIFCSPHIGHO2_02_FULL_40_24]|uniref:VIT family protein n=1 Tax=Candidatus Gottesmanbacteria bacterium RIFCSPHIGHO2_01_FULL_40_15 TaxID=1798376 RepID=A0A1F5Z7A1_9BACT|nr:MAG: hypothetical protein A2777_02245 [Candidatus Gottesmanbacteria bacterium RIFCSPHIGHO2_01_FULL_40_15]OGG16506.1 MAG: hypothetical protein A3D05_05610 [Candidatus Gottesmanbacteria bacterium RIFCSPHIGHO2_02_FULL_40_24]OGG22584.1 MAG: hypothetical protein A3B48_02085 [Candidatus Gottesmanbacteria bacterium RIFCSPLOWO2_01_FULL_40_10]OGG25619.1 MAG: hypothetical protein A3E42_04760 [Candidatus Gottesmanbacteria bacterium RIFCSPHIGHO2_12_FULL_40_13]OGG32623.1 MAG: hypothetical protein A3I80_0